MAGGTSDISELDQEKYDADERVKVICLGDSAVGKSKLLGYGRAGTVSEHAPILLLQSSRLYHADMKVTQRNFNFAKKQGLPLYYVSAADGTNVVKLFKDAIKLAMSYKQNSSDFMDEVMRELENFELEQKEESSDKEENVSKDEKTNLP
ncbi:hypothetical protein JZ751_022136 [Albula glossodonta]|uniref:Rab-like protein 2A n=1 Tax=Albula glossodonta TaxID=121402 RepID=A0A8T2NI08_9TELE|nr:hypothetical protein JZ751_022136 [Albula glossodonta]